MVGVDRGEPVLGGSELSNLEVIGVVSKGGLVFHDVEQAGLLGAVNSSWTSYAGNIFGFRYLKKG